MEFTKGTLFGALAGMLDGTTKKVVENGINNYSLRYFSFF